MQPIIAILATFFFLLFRVFAYLLLFFRSEWYPKIEVDPPASPHADFVDQLHFGNSFTMMKWCRGCECFQKRQLVMGAHVNVVLVVFRFWVQILGTCQPICLQRTKDWAFSEEATGDGCSCDCCSGCVQILGSDFGNMPAHYACRGQKTEHSQKRQLVMDVRVTVVLVVFRFWELASPLCLQRTKDWAFSEEATGDGCSCDCCSGCVQILGTHLPTTPAKAERLSVSTAVCDMGQPLTSSMWTMTLRSTQPRRLAAQS